MHTRSIRSIVAALGLVALGGMWAVSGIGCASEEGDGFVGNGGDGGAGASSAGGDGGTGGVSLCDQDCSLIETPQCLVAVCNEGQLPGAIGTCVVTNADTGTPCEDGAFCTVDDYCDAGQCKGGGVNDCGMDIPPCQDVLCDETSEECSTSPSPNGAVCVPDDLCQVNAVCSNGKCEGEPKDCFFSPFGECNSVACNPSSGNCEPTPDPLKNGLSCDQTGDPCMVSKQCDNGQCAGGVPKDCSALTVGCQNGVCNANTGACMGEAVAAGGMCFEAADDCNVGICDAGGNCNPVPANQGMACNDYDSCTTNTTCNNGNCTGQAIVDCSVYFEDTFEAGCPPAGWTLGGDWECGNPSAVGPQAAFSGGICVATQIDANYSASQSYDVNVAQLPPVNLAAATAPVVSFMAWVDTEGSSYDGFNVKVSTNGGASWTVVSGVTPAYNLTVSGETAWGGHQSAAGWQRYTANLAAYAGQQILVRLSMRTDGSGQYPGVYIDDLVVAEPEGVPIVITTTASLPEAVVGQPYAAALTKTGGTASSVWSIVGGTNHGWMTINPSTGALGGTPGAGNVGAGTVIVHVTEPAEPNNFDEQTFNFEVVTAVYANNFDGACPNGWTLTGDWECGVPSMVGPAASYSGTQCIATQIDANYSSNQAWGSTTATSPAIDLTGTTNPLVRFRVWLDTEGSTYDGFNLKVSTNGGASYQLVNTVTPTYPLTVNGEQAWGGRQSASGWQLFTADLTAFAGTSLNLQFAFRTDGSVVYPGVYIDDVQILD